MDAPTEHGGTWWRGGDDGRWLRWDPIASAWMTSATGPWDEGAPQAVRVEPFAPLWGHMRWAVGFLAAAVIFDAIAVLSGVQEYLLLGEMMDGFVTMEEAEANDARQALVGMLQLGLLIMAVIAFLRWFRRAYANLPGLSVPPAHKTGWAIGAWFVPLLEYVRPKKMADELWRAGSLDDNFERVPLYVHLWWAAWLLANFIGRVAGGAYMSAEEPETIRDGAGWIIASDVLSVLAGILAIRLVRDVTARQHAKRAALESEAAPLSGLPTPPPQSGP